MFTARAQVQVDRPVEQVWPVVVDRRRDPEWREESVVMELLEGDPTEPGAVFREVIRFGPQEVEPAAAGCRVTFVSRAEVRGRWSFTEPVFRWLFQRSLDRELPNLRDFLEAGDDRSGRH